MKIIHLTSGGDVGGAKTHVHSLLQGLGRTETVRLICFMEGSFAKEARDLGIPTTVLLGKLRDNLSALHDMIQTEKYDIIHCHGARANLYGALLKQRLNVPVVTTVHSDYRLDYMGRAFANLTYGNVNRWALRQMDNWIGVSNVMVEQLIQRDFDPQRIFEIYNGVRFDGLTPKLTRQEFLDSIGLQAEESSVIFGIAARINPIKDMETLVRAFAKVVAQEPSVRLVIAGDGEQRKEIEALAQQLCPPGSYRFAGWLQDTVSFYHAIDVNLLTSLSEGFPYALPEGARMRCATIASRVGGVPKLIDHEINGLLFTPKDIDTLAGHMLRLAQEPGLCRQFGDRLYEKTKRDFSVDSTVKRQLEIYHTILRRRERSRQRRRDGILICGAYGRGNRGDDAILSTIVAQLHQADPDIPICVVSRKPRQTKLEFRTNAIYTFRFLSLRKQMKSTALYLSGGGSLIQDVTSSRSLWYYLQSIRDAKHFGCKVLMFACGIGPVTRPGNRKRAANTIRRYVDAITLRDEESRQELMRLGADKVPVEVTADVVLLTESAPENELRPYLQQCGIRADGKYLLIAPRPWQGAEKCLAALAEAAAYAKRKYGLTPVLLAMEPGKDLPVCWKIAQALKTSVPEHLVLKAPQNASLTVGLVQQMQGVLAMRLHALILAAAQSIPLGGIAYDPKVSSFLTDYDGHCCPLAQTDTAVLCRLIDRMLSDGAENRISARHLRSMAMKNFEIVQQMLQ